MIIGVFIDLKDHHILKFSDLKSRFDEVKSEFVGIVECLSEKWYFFLQAMVKMQRYLQALC